MPDARLPLRNKRPGDLIYIDNSGEEIVLHLPSGPGSVPAVLGAGFFAGIPIVPTWVASSDASIGLSHNLLGTGHSDSAVQTASRGSLIVGNSGPVWDELVIGSANKVLKSDGTDASWQFIDNLSISDRTRSFFISAQAFTLHTGTATYALRGAGALVYPTFNMPDAAANLLETLCQMPKDYISGAITVKVHWTNAAATVGNVHWDVYAQNAAATTNLSTNALTTGGNDAGAGGQDVQVITTSAISFTPSAEPAIVQLFVQRNGNHANDNLTNDAYFVGVTVEYTADM